jgi:hypothetical protein
MYIVEKFCPNRKKHGKHGPFSPMPKNFFGGAGINFSTPAESCPKIRNRRKPSL